MSRTTSGFAREHAEGQLNRYNTVQDFFKIELENESLREEIYEIQSSFTRNDHEYLEITQQKYYAETEYDNYRNLAQQEIQNLAEDLKDKEIELQKIRANLNMAKNGGLSHASGFSIETENDKLK
jgi:predicted RNase H-like nuclease (RuvC/YqgF family)